MNADSPSLSIDQSLETVHVASLSLRTVAASEACVPMTSLASFCVTMLALASVAVSSSVRLLSIVVDPLTRKRPAPVIASSVRISFARKTSVASAKMSNWSSASLTFRYIVLLEIFTGVRTGISLSLCRHIAAAI